MLRFYRALNWKPVQPIRSLPTPAVAAISRNQAINRPAYLALQAFSGHHSQTGAIGRAWRNHAALRLSSTIKSAAFFALKVLFFGLLAIWAAFLIVISSDDWR